MNWRRQKAYYEIISRDATIWGEADEKVARCVGLPLEEVQKLANELK